MAQRVTQISVKQNGVWGNPVPLGANAQNVIMNNQNSVQEEIGLIYNTIPSINYLTTSDYNNIPNNTKNSNGIIYFVNSVSS